MCPAATLARAGLLLCLVVGSRQLSITELVVPSTVQVGETAELACRFDRGSVPEDSFIVKWWWTPLNSTRTQLYQRIGTARGAPMLHELQIKEGDTIVLTNTTPSHSGTYECEVNAMTEKVEEDRRHQDLIVFTPGSGPQLNLSSVEDGPDEDLEEDVLVECHADDVAPEPDIMLKINGVEFQNVTEDVIGPDGAGYYDAASTARLSRAEADGAEVTCELFYKDTNIKHSPYTAAETYHSGETTTELLEDTTASVNTTEPFKNQSGDSTAIRASLAMLLTFAVFTQLLAVY